MEMLQWLFLCLRPFSLKLSPNYLFSLFALLSFPSSPKKQFLLPAASQLVEDKGRWVFGMGHQFLELVSVIVFD